MRKLFICLANSKKYNERCIAGIEVVLGADQRFHVIRKAGKPKWIRPVTNAVHGEIPARLVDDMKLMDVYEIETIRPCPKGYQSENVLFYQNSLKKIKTLEDITSKKMKWIAEQEKKGLFYGYDRKVSTTDIAFIDHSLCLVRAENIQIYNKKYREWEVVPRLRANFKYKNTTYDLPITDVAFIEKYVADNTFLKKVKDVFITVSMSAEFEGWYYKLAAGLICIE